MIEIQRILCPIDFSDTSRRALDHALALARWYGATVSVLYVHQLSTPIYAACSIVPEPSQPIALTGLECEQLKTAVHEYVAHDRLRSGVPIEVAVDESIDVAGAILSQAKSSRADLIVVGTHGRSGFKRLLLGSVTEKLLRQAHCPVLTVPPAAPAVVSQLVAIERVLCPVDFSSGSSSALRYAASLAEAASARLTVLHVLEVLPDLSEPTDHGHADYRLRRFEQARHDLQEAIRTCVPSTCTVSELLLAGKAYREILRVAGEQSADLIVMGVQGRGTLDRMIFGSTTNQVVRGAACPVLTLRHESR